MIIKKISCEQFAGIRNQELELEENMNVIVGKNESGKTTMMELAYHVLNTGVDIKRNEKKEYFSTYMPSERAGGLFSGDHIDGTVQYQEGKDVFTIQKIWMKEENGICQLVDGSGTSIRSRKNVEDVLRHSLKFGQAVYRNLIFSSQKDRERILKGILCSAEDEGVKEAKGELASRVTQTVMELDGVSLEQLEEMLEKQVLAYESNWDSNRKKPKVKAKAGNSRWEKNVGKILESYYVLLDLQKEMERAEQAEQEYERAGKAVSCAKKQAEQAGQQMREFQKYAADIENRNQNEELTEKYQRELAKMQSDEKNWPVYQTQYKKLQGLRKEWEKANEAEQAKEKFAKRKLHEEKIASLEKEIKSTGDVSIDDYKEAVLMAEEIKKCEMKLNQLPVFKGTIQKFQEDHDIVIFQGADSQEVEVKDGEFRVDQVFTVSIPEIMELQISPETVNAKEIQLELRKRQSSLDKILLSYHVKSLGLLQKKYERTQEIYRQLEMEKTLYQAFLEGTSSEEIEKAYSETKGEYRQIEEIQREIDEICGRMQSAEVAGRLKGDLDSLERRYTSVDALKTEIQETKDRLKSLAERLDNLREIPEVYLEYKNPQSGAEHFQKLYEQAEEMRREKEALLMQCEQEIPEKTAEEIQLEYENALAEFERNRETCQHWKHILEVFHTTKAGMQKNPAADIEEKTRQYLEEMTDECVTLQQEQEALELKVFSHGNQMNYRLLSEGTKQTVELAFRLAVLENLYGDEKGFAVFDDSLIDMDPERRKMAANLLRRFSEKHQVIYVTCDPQFSKLLGGKTMEFC